MEQIHNESCSLTVTFIGLHFYKTFHVFLFYSCISTSKSAFVDLFSENRMTCGIKPNFGLLKSIKKFEILPIENVDLGNYVINVVKEARSRR